MAFPYQTWTFRTTWPHGQGGRLSESYALASAEDSK
jgi:hypothetical protein